MSPLIRAKCSHKAGMSCFSDLAIILYYEIMRLGFDYNRIGIIFFIVLLIIAWKKAQEKAEALWQYWCLMMILIFHTIWSTIFLEIARIKTI